MIEEAATQEPQVPCKACPSLIGVWSAKSTDKRFPRPFEGESKGLCEECKARLYLQHRAGLQIAYKQWLTTNFPTPSFIYGLLDPRSRDVCYVGRTNDIAKRMNHHRREATWESSIKATWINELHELGLTFEHCILAVVEPGYRVIEMEARWICEGMRRGWPLTNLEATDPYVVKHTRQYLNKHKDNTNYCFECPIEELPRHNRAALRHIEAYLHWSENMPHTLPDRFAIFHLV